MNSNGIEFDFGTAGYPAIFYENEYLQKDNIYHLCTRVRRFGECLGYYDLIEINPNMYMMASGVRHSILISKESLENKYNCHIDENTYCKIFKITQ